MFVLTPTMLINISAFDTFGKNTLLFNFKLSWNKIITILDSISLLSHHDLEWIDWLISLLFGLFDLIRFRFHAKECSLFLVFFIVDIKCI